jgi:hypothetical protein
VKNGIVPSIESANGESQKDILEDGFATDIRHLLYDLKWRGVGAFLEQIVVEVGAFLEVIVVEEVSNLL